jgi:hypothetical protein
LCCVCKVVFVCVCEKERMCRWKCTVKGEKGVLHTHANVSDTHFLNTFFKYTHAHFHSYTRSSTHFSYTHSRNTFHTYSHFPTIRFTLTQTDTFDAHINKPIFYISSPKKEFFWPHVAPARINRLVVQNKYKGPLTSGILLTIDTAVRVLSYITKLAYLTCLAYIT